MHTACRLAIASCFAATAACGGDPTDPLASVTSVTIGGAPPTLAAIGDSVVLQAVARRRDGATAPASIAWTSAAPAVATVRAGVVHARANGTAHVIARVGRLADTVEVTVLTVQALAIASRQPTLTSIGDSLTLAATASDGDGAPVAGVAVTWTSSAPLVATVERGVLVARGNGTTLLTATVGARIDTTTVAVRQRPARLTFLTTLGEQLQGHPLPSVRVAVADARGVRVAGATEPVTLTATVGAIEGTLSRVPAADGVATFDDVLLTEPTRATRLVARAGDASVETGFFGAALALASVSAGHVHTCGLSVTGQAFCWGYAGRNGDGSERIDAVPTRVVGTAPFRTLDAGAGRFVALSTTGSLATGGDQEIPVQFAGSIASVATNWHSCLVASDQRAYCWGTSASYFGGDVSLGYDVRETPTLALGGRALSAIAVGLAHTCGIAATDGTAWCAGNNPNGALGDGTTAFATTPVPVAGGLRFVAIDAGINFTCGITTIGETWCWGLNDVGQLGASTAPATSSTLPVRVAGGHRFTSITLGGAHACGLMADGTAHCWGRNFYGMLGNADPMSAHSPTPSPVAGGHRWRSISAGGFHTCGIATTGHTYCWGDFINRATGTNEPAWQGPRRIAIPHDVPLD